MSFTYDEAKRIVRALERIADAVDGGPNKDFPTYVQAHQPSKPAGADGGPEGIDVTEKQYVEVEDDRGTFETMVHNVTHGINGTDETVHPGHHNARSLVTRFLNLSVTARLHIATDIVGISPDFNQLKWSADIIQSIHNAGRINDLIDHPFMQTHVHLWDVS